MKLQKIYYKVFWIGLVSLALAFVLGFGRVLLERTLALNKPFLNTVTIIAVFGFLVFLASALVLWIDSLIFTIRTWRNRNLAINLMLIIFLIVGHFLAAFLIYGLRQKHDLGGNQNAH